MRKIYNVLTVVMGMLLVCSNVQAQTEILIKKTDWGDFTDIKYSILSDSIANIIAESSDKNIQFVLERNSVYFVASEIVNPDFHLRIKAEEGEGTQPLIMLKLNDETGDWPKMFSTQNDVTFENLHITYEKGDKVSRYSHKANNFGGEGSQVWFKGCYFERERQAPIRLAASGMTLKVEDSRVGNAGPNNGLDGNGRVFDSRGNSADSVIFRNCTFYNISDRVFRSSGAHINYVEMDHITAFSHLGRHECINLSTVNKAVIKNWLFMDAQMLGSGRTAMATEHYKYDGWENQYYISLNSAPDSIGTELEIHHNNFTPNQEVVNRWESIDSLEAPGLLNSVILDVMGDAAADAFLANEWVDFANVPTFPYEAIDSVYYYYTPDDMDNLFDMYLHDTTLFIENLDISYSSTYAAYTAGEEGFPLGDLNAFPAMREAWGKGDGPVVISNKTNSFEEEMLNCYPNPFNSYTNISYTVAKESNVNLSVYSVDGKLINKLVSQKQAAGSYNLQWDGSSFNGQAKSGTYLVVMHIGEKVDATYVVLTK